MPHTKVKRERTTIAGNSDTAANGVSGEPLEPDAILRNYKDARDTLVFARQKAAAGVRDAEMPVSRAENLWRQARRDAAEVLRGKVNGRMTVGGCVYHLHVEYNMDGRLAAYGVSVHRKMRKKLEGTAPFLVNGWRRYGVNE